MIALLLPLVTPPAAACGGLFCNRSVPVIQEAERVVFAVDEARGTVDMHVQVFFEGEADDFAWIVPVPSEPRIFPSNQELFDRLSRSTTPAFRLDSSIEGQCRTYRPEIFSQSLSIGGSGADADWAPPVPAVQVVSEQLVGPYETEVLSTPSESALVSYLTERGYDLPDGLSEALEPYVEAGTTHFLALRLATGADTGDISPIGLSYEGTEPAIPIRLTRVAVTEDLPLEVYVFGGRRAVPLSYLHVQLNEAAIDWFQGGANYFDVVAAAVDEAGGRAFVTDYAGPSEPFAWSVTFAREPLAAADSFESWVQEIRRQGVPANDHSLAVVADVAGIADVEPEDLWECPSCYEGEVDGFDAVAATDLLDGRVLEPLERIEALFDHSVLTRFTSTLSAAEMTVDPVFAMHGGEPVEQVRTAELVTECHARRERSEAPRRLELADGRQLALPSTRWMIENRATDFDLLGSQRDIRARVVEQFHRDGRREVLFDYTDELADLADAHERAIDELVGCSRGCRTQGPVMAWSGLGALGLLLALRRRRARS